MVGICLLFFQNSLLLYICGSSGAPFICILLHSCDGDLAVYIKALESSLVRIPPNSLSKVSIICRPSILITGD